MTTTPQAASDVLSMTTDDSVATLVHAFVVSRVDYCGSLDPDWRSEEDDRKVATFSTRQHGSSRTRASSTGGSDSRISGEVSYTG